MDASKPVVRQEEPTLLPMPEITGERSIWSLMRDQAQVLVKSGMLPSSVKSAESAMAIMQTGREFGLQPMQSFRVIHIIEGKPTLSAQFMAALVNRHCAKHGGYLRQAELSEERCVIEYKRGEWPAPQTFSFSMEDAKRAGLATRGTWQKHPREMMYNRAVSNACRMGWPELVAGVYDPDELDAPTYSVHQVEPPPNRMWSTVVSEREMEMHEEEALDANEREVASRRFFAQIKNKGLTEDERHAIQRIAYGVESFTELDTKQINSLTLLIHEKSADELRERIKEQAELDRQAAQDQQDLVPDQDDAAVDPASPIPDFLKQIRAAKDEAALNAITQSMQAIGVWAPEVTTAVVDKRNALGLPAPQADKGGMRPVGDILDQSPLLSGEPGMDRHSS